MEREGARQNQFCRGILRGQGHGLHRLVDRRPLRIVGRELRQISLGQAGMPRGEIRSHVDQVLEGRQRIVALAERELRIAGNIEQGGISRKFFQRVRRAGQRLLSLADAQLEARQRDGDFGDRRRRSARLSAIRLRPSPRGRSSLRASASAM